MAQGKTILMVTHDRDLANRASRTVIIADGEIIEEYLAKTFPSLTEGRLRAGDQADLPAHLPARHDDHPGGGTPPENFYIITEGEVEVHLRAPNGKEFVVARMGKGQCVGEVELFRGGNSLATVRASIDKGAEVAALDPSEFAALMALVRAHEGIHCRGRGRSASRKHRRQRQRCYRDGGAGGRGEIMIRPRWRKILRDIWRNKRRTILMVLSIAVGVFAVGTVAQIRAIVTDDMVESYEAANPPSAILYTAEPFDDDMVEAVRRMPQVAEAEARREVLRPVSASPIRHLVPDAPVRCAGLRERSASAFCAAKWIWP